LIAYQTPLPARAIDLDQCPRHRRNDDVIQLCGVSVIEFDSIRDERLAAIERQRNCEQRSTTLLARHPVKLPAAAV